MFDHSLKNRIKLFFYPFIHFFLENKINRLILKNSFWLSLAQGISGFVNLFLAIFIARTLGPSEYGKFAYALSFVTLFSTIFDFGLTVTVTREFAKNSDEEKYFQNILFLKMIIGVLAIFLIIFISFFITQDKTLRSIIFILGVYRFFFEALNLVYAFFRARQNMQFEALIRFLQALGLFLVIAIMIYIGASVIYLSYAYAISTFFAFFTTLMVLFSQKKIFQHFQFKFNHPIYKKYLLIGWYLALAQGAGDIMVNTDSFLLGYWGMLNGVGLYNAAAKINFIVLFPMSLITTALFPALIQALKKSETQFIQLWQHWMKGTLFFAVMVSFFVCYQAETIIRLFFGETYLPAAATLKILLIMAMIVYINNLYFQVILIFNQQKIIFYSQLVGCIINILLNFILIPRWNINGAAIATIGGQLISGIFYARVIAKHTIIQPFSPAFISTLITAMMAGCLMLLSLSFIGIAWFVPSICMGVLIYSLLFFTFNKLFQLTISGWMNNAKS